MKYLLRILPVFLLCLCACVEIKSSSLKTSDSDEEEEYNEIDELFSKIDPAHNWNMAISSWLNIVTDYQPDSVGVYVRYCNRYYSLAVQKNCTAENSLIFDVPRDVKSVYFLIDGFVAETDLESTVFVGQSDVETADKPAWLEQAQPLPWIVAADCDNDLDFNDLVAQIRRDADGNMRIKALAGGTSRKVWLHYLGNKTDYFITSQDDEERAVEYRFVDENNCVKFCWHKWFTQNGNEMASGYAVNTLGAANGWSGKEIELPHSLFEDGLFTMSEWGISEVHTMKDEENDYAKPLRGFYLTVEKHDYTLAEQEEDIHNYLVTTWLLGDRPKFLIFPDVSPLDTELEHKGWCWPSEKSPIHLVYPYFSDWIYDHTMVWYADEPQGWDNYPGVTNEYGAYLYYGYYPRHRLQP